MFVAWYWTQVRDGKMASAPDEPKQRKHDGDCQAGEDTDSNDAEQRQHGLCKLVHMKLIETLQFTYPHHPSHCVDDDCTKDSFWQIVEKRHERDQSDQHHSRRPQ